MILLDQIRTLDPVRVLIEETTRRLTVGELLAGAGPFASGGSGASIAVYTSSPISGLRAMAALDGRAAAVLLVPGSTPPAEARALVLAASCTVVITDRVDALKSLDLPTVGDVSALANAAVADEHDSRVETRWLFATSGTTGAPKIVSHSLASLARTTRTSSGSGAMPVWAMLYDFARFAGMQVLLQSVLSGAILIVPDSELSLDQQLAQLAGAGVTHVSATPTLWRKIVMTPNAGRLALRQITLGGEIADARILSTLKATFPAGRIVHIFASTEAGVGFSVSDGQPGFPASYLEKPPSGVEIRIHDGCLQIRNPLVVRTYVGGPGEFADVDGWVATGDVVEVAGDRVYFLGRADGAINVGGNKVIPEEVEGVLLGHQAVSAARVFGHRNPIVGALVAAEVQLTESPDLGATAAATLRAYCAERLPAHKVPALIRVVDRIAASSAGKTARRDA